MSEKKYNNLWLYVSIALMVLILVLLGVIFLGRKNTNSDDFEKKTYCHSLYDRVYDSIDEQINDHDNTISQFMSNFDFFYSKKTDSCIVSYVRNATYYDNNQRVNSDTYIIKDYLSDENIYYCNESNSDYSEKNCYLDMLDELKKLK